ncbi:MAG TPA: Type 1 glutamine amidotransferase-like domain-containing protein [Caulobacteraceae bacterium]|nr:Type 1 glutamine amidotransferase-like domain-containing protein [Caulobacteraceae bacterium]
MRLYLSSYQIGDCPDALEQLLGENRRAALIANALDPYPNPEEGRTPRLARQATHLGKLGCACEELDLRDYFGRSAALANKLSEFGLIWVHGGNSFVLKRAFEQSGCDHILADMLRRDVIVYGGFSAALMMVMPTMRGIDLCDDIVTVPEGYRPEFSWDSLGLISYSIVPHYRSEHPESAMMEDVVRYMDEHRMPYRTLHDGEAIVIDADGERLVGRREDV